MQTALLLIAHGSRQEEANADLYHMVAELRRRATHPIVEAAFLELAEPDIETAAARCVSRGAERIVLLPYFLAAGVHVRRDLNALCLRLTGRYSAVQFRLAEPLGRHPLLLEVLMDRIRQAEEQPKE